MKIVRFEDVISWQKSQTLAKMTYKHFASCRDFGFKDQICRAVVSISNNIAEGFERRTDSELTYFMYIAKGSAGEFRSMLYLSLSLGYISRESFDTLFNLSLEVSRLLHAFINSLKSTVS